MSDRRYKDWARAERPDTGDQCDKSRIETIGRFLRNVMVLLHTLLYPSQEAMHQPIAAHLPSLLPCRLNALVARDLTGSASCDHFFLQGACAASHSRVFAPAVITLIAVRQCM